MVSGVEPLDLPDDGGADAACSSVSRGLVMHVDRCLDHEHWIHLHSLGKWEAEADGVFHVLAHDDAIIESDAEVRIAAAIDVDIEAREWINLLALDTIALRAGNIIDITADGYTRSLSPHVILGFEAPYLDDRDGVLQLKETAESGIYLGNTDNPGRRVLDWYEEGAWQVQWSAGGVAIEPAGTATYTRVGNIVVIHVLIDVLLPPPGAAAWTFSLPVPPAGNHAPCGSAVLTRGGVRLEATATLGAGQACLLLADADVTTAHPGMAEGDHIAFSLAYRAA